MTFPLATATPRLTFPQQSGTSSGMAWRYCQSCLPVAASRAQTYPSYPLTYITPSTTIGVASNAYVAGVATRPMTPLWNIQATFRSLTFPVLIWLSGL